MDFRVLYHSGSQGTMKFLGVSFLRAGCVSVDFFEGPFRSWTRQLF